MIISDTIRKRPKGIPKKIHANRVLFVTVAVNDDGSVVAGGQTVTIGEMVKYAPEGAANVADLARRYNAWETNGVEVDNERTECFFDQVEAVAVADAYNERSNKIDQGGNPEWVAEAIISELLIYYSEQLPESVDYA